MHIPHTPLSSKTDTVSVSGILTKGQSTKELHIQTSTGTQRRNRKSEDFAVIVLYFDDANGTAKEILSLGNIERLNLRGFGEVMDVYVEKGILYNSYISGMEDNKDCGTELAAARQKVGWRGKDNTLKCFLKYVLKSPQTAPCNTYY